MAGAFGLAQIGQIAVRVKDLDRAIEFYRDTLGMAFLFRVPDMAFFDCAGVRLMLALPEDQAFDQPSSLIYYQVEDIESGCRALAERGVVFLSEPHLVARMADHDLWMAFFEDPEENTLALMSEVRGS